MVASLVFRAGKSLGRTTPGASLLMQLNGRCPDVVAGERGKDPSLGNGVAFGMIRWHQVLIPIMPYLDECWQGVLGLEVILSEGLQEVSEWELI